MKAIIYFFIAMVTTASILLFSYYFTLKTDFDGNFNRWQLTHSVKFSQNSKPDIFVEIDSAGIIKCENNKLGEYWEASVSSEEIEKLKEVSEKNDIFYIESMNPSDLYKSKNSTRISIIADNGKENSFLFVNISEASKQMLEIDREIRKLIRKHKPT